MNSTCQHTYTVALILLYKFIWRQTNMNYNVIFFFLPHLPQYSAITHSSGTTCVAIPTPYNIICSKSSIRNFVYPIIYRGSGESYLLSSGLLDIGGPFLIYQLLLCLSSHFPLLLKVSSYFFKLVQKGWYFIG